MTLEDYLEMLSLFIFRFLLRCQAFILLDEQRELIFKSAMLLEQFLGIDEQVGVGVHDVEVH